MNCSEIQDLLSTYYDDELDDAQAKLVSEHLETCGDCARTLGGFKTLSKLVSASPVPEAVKPNWSQIEERLDGESSKATSQEKPTGQRSFAIRNFALAATVLIAIGVGWVAYMSVMHRRQHAQFAAEFGEYLNAFDKNADAAQELLLAKYDNQRIDPALVSTKLGYRPAVSQGLPDGYEVESTHVMTMPCCTCVQSLCRRSDGSVLAIFEHDDEETNEWFGDRPETMAECADRRCSLVALDSDIAATWQRGSRHITLIGVRDSDEVSKIVAWMDSRDSGAAN